MSKLIPLLLLVGLILPALSRADDDQHDPDIDYIVNVLEQTPCSQVQVLAARNIAVIRWDQASMRFLYGEDIEAIRHAARKSGKRVIRVKENLPIPNLNDAGWETAYDQLIDKLTSTFEQDYQSHPPDGC